MHKEIRTRKTSHETGAHLIENEQIQEINLQESKNKTKQNKIKTWEL